MFERLTGNDQSLVDFMRRSPFFGADELRKGIEGVLDAKRRMALVDWLETDLSGFFAGRLLHIDAPVADRWVRLLGAIAVQHGLSMVTCNERGFTGLGLDVINPWTK